MKTGVIAVIAGAIALAQPAFAGSGQYNGVYKPYTYTNGIYVVPVSVTSVSNVPACATRNRLELSGFSNRSQGAGHAYASDHRVLRRTIGFN